MMLRRLVDKYFKLTAHNTTLRTGIVMGTVKKIRLSLTWVLLAITFISCSWGCAASEEANMPIVLLTDFGTDGYWVPELKGIIYSNHPSAQVIDATHDVPVFDVEHS